MPKNRPTANGVTEGLETMSRLEDFLRLQRQLDDSGDEPASEVESEGARAVDAALQELLAVLPRRGPSRGFTGRVLMAAGVAPWWALPANPRVRRWTHFGMRAAALVATVQLALLLAAAGAVIVSLVTQQGVTGALSWTVGAAVWLVKVVPDAASFAQGGLSWVRSAVGAAVTPSALLLISVCLTVAFSALYVLSQVVESDRSVAHGGS